MLAHELRLRCVRRDEGLCELLDKLLLRLQLLRLLLQLLRLLLCLLLGSALHLAALLLRLQMTEELLKLRGRDRASLSRHVSVCGRSVRNCG